MDIQYPGFEEDVEALNLLQTKFPSAKDNVTSVIYKIIHDEENLLNVEAYVLYSSEGAFDAINAETRGEMHKLLFNYFASAKDSHFTYVRSSSTETHKAA
jgi:hypothetical protein